MVACSSDQHLDEGKAALEVNRVYTERQRTESLFWNAVADRAGSKAETDYRLLLCRPQRQTELALRERDIALPVWKPL
jgi:hypothetical protein